MDKIDEKIKTCFLSIMLLDSTGGLKVEHRPAKQPFKRGLHWIDVTNEPGTLFVSIGGKFDKITESSYYARDHKWFNPTEKRNSIAYYLGDNDAFEREFIGPPAPKPSFLG
jgi:isopenicillin N synthase-like dioxygenase